MPFLAEGQLSIADRAVGSEVGFSWWLLLSTPCSLLLLPPPLLLSLLSLFVDKRP